MSDETANPAGFGDVSVCRCKLCFGDATFRDTGPDSPLEKLADIPAGTLRNLNTGCLTGLVHRIGPVPCRPGQGIQCYSELFKLRQDFPAKPVGARLFHNLFIVRPLSRLCASRFQRNFGAVFLTVAEPPIAPRANPPLAPYRDIDGKRGFLPFLYDEVQDERERTLAPPPPQHRNPTRCYPGRYP